MPAILQMMTRSPPTITLLQTTKSTISKDVILTEVNWTIYIRAKIVISITKTAAVTMIMITTMMMMMIMVMMMMRKPRFLFTISINLSMSK